MCTHVGTAGLEEADWAVVDGVELRAPWPGYCGPKKLWAGAGTYAIGQHGVAVAVGKVWAVAVLGKGIAMASGSEAPPSADTYGKGDPKQQRTGVGADHAGTSEGGALELGSAACGGGDTASII